MTNDTPSVVHVRDGYDVYIGRACRGKKASKWANPFHLPPGVDITDRRKCLAKYAAWIFDRPELLHDLAELTGKRLGCWCAPQSCHGDVLAALWKLSRGITRTRQEGGK